jgi:hypothetical protein
MPLGVLGTIVHALAIRRQLEAIFGFRESAIAARFGSVTPGARP